MAWRRWEWFVAGVGDVRGKRLLHLQCDFGMDTLSWARRGASVVGLDFSDAAIAAARELAAEVALLPASRMHPPAARSTRGIDRA